MTTSAKGSTGHATLRHPLLTGRFERALWRLPAAYGQPYIDWFNRRRLHGDIGAGYSTPAEAEALYYRQAAPAEMAVTQTTEQS